MAIDAVVIGARLPGLSDTAAAVRPMVGEMPFVELAESAAVRFGGCPEEVFECRDGPFRYAETSSRRLW